MNHGLKPTWPPCIPFREGLVRQRPQGLHPCEGRCFSLRLFWIGVSQELTPRNFSQARCWPRSPRPSASRSGRDSPLRPRSAHPKRFLRSTAHTRKGPTTAAGKIPPGSIRTREETITLSRGTLLAFKIHSASLISLSAPCVKKNPGIAFGKVAPTGRAL